MPQLTVRDFGPLAEASVDLKPLTVFIGPNNAGKSYLALAIYALSSALAGESPMVIPLRAQQWIKMPRMRRVTVEDRALFRGLGETARQLLTPGRLPSRAISGTAQESILKALESQARVLSTDFRLELQRCYGTEVDKLGRRDSSLEHHDFSIIFTDEERGLLWETKSAPDALKTVQWQTRLSDDDKESLIAALPPSSFFSDVKPEDIGRMLRPLIFSALYGYGALLPRAYYLPASRSGILLGHKTLASLIVGRSSLAWVEPMEIPRLPGVITDLIQTLLLLDRQRPTSDPIKRIAAFVEGQIAQGTINVDLGKGEYPEIFYETPAGRFLLHQVSSMVSETAPLVVFLKHVVRPGDLLIIEEPESHLDAKNQRNIARAIARLVHASVKILVTTHSDYFLNQLNNLLQLSQIGARRRSSRGYLAEEVLRPDDVGAYLFHPASDGTSVETLQITPAQGISTAQFAEVHRALYDEAIGLEHLLANR